MSLDLEVHTETWAHCCGLGPAGAQGLRLAISKNSVTGDKALAGCASGRIDTKVVTWHHGEAQLETLGDRDIIVQRRRQTTVRGEQRTV